MYGTLDISVGGMIVQRTRQTVAAANIASSNVTLSPNGDYAPYLRRHLMVAPGDPTARTAEGRALGVHVHSIETDPTSLRPKLQPGHPNADENGYVLVSDINSVMEQMNAMEAARAYEANLAVAEATKTMMAQALRLVA